MEGERREGTEEHWSEIEGERNAGERKGEGRDRQDGGKEEQKAVRRETDGLKDRDRSEKKWGKIKSRSKKRSRKGSK